MPNLGSWFRARREERGCTLDEIAARTRIPRRLLVELERDSFEHWPASRVYRIGFLKAYATAIGLDPEQAIAQFDAETTASPHPASHDAGDEHAAPNRPRPIVSLMLAVSGCVFAALLAGLPLYVEPTGPAAAQTPNVSRPPADIALDPDTPAVPTSGGFAAATDIDGELRIDSIPSGTHVVVNGIARGATPVRLRYLPIGSYRIRLVRDGYESKETLATITNEQPVRSISITLRERLP
jgi:transcriptional regulator with XRE-family HTH domain